MISEFIKIANKNKTKCKELIKKIVLISFLRLLMKKIN